MQEIKKLPSLCSILLSGFLLLISCSAQKGNKNEPEPAKSHYRVIVSTDIGGTDPDDFQSMVHLLLYADTLDIEGLISSPFGPGRKEHILQVIDQYEKDYPSLKDYSEKYPAPDSLRSITKQGAIDVAGFAGFDKPTEGSEWIVKCARKKDSRPLYILVWGGIEDLAQALHDAPDILPKLWVYYIGGPNKKWSPDACQYIADHFPELWMIESNATYRGWFTGGNQEGEWSNEGFPEKHIKDKGALGTFFMTQLGGSIKMGDTPSLAWLLNSPNPEDPTLPNWGGQYIKAWERPYFLFDKLPSKSDSIQEFSIIEIALLLNGNLPEKPEARLLVENQALSGYFGGDGKVRFRFSPKSARTFDFIIESNINSINGKTGNITAYIPPAELANHPSSKYPNWWTDNPNPEFAEGEHIGAKTVSRWRKEFLKDFAKRMERCVYTQAKHSTWIWYPGDYDIWLGNQVQNRRTERGTFFPPFWKMDSHYILVEFSKKLDLQTSETITIKAEGQYNVKLDGKLLFGSPEQVTVPAGKHSLYIKVHNQAGVPAIYVNGKTVQSDNSWQVTYEDKEWIDESGKASDTSSGTVYLNAASWNFNSPDTPPSQSKLPTQPMFAVSNEKKNKGMLYDFGKETFGFARFNGLKGKGTLNVYYGESPEEALSVDHCETLDRLPIDFVSATDYTVSLSKAFRYIYVEKDTSLSYDSVSMLYEYLPLDYKGSFRCNDEQINKIWDVAAYTLHLTTREFFIDGIKRDRWMWSGDAYQSYLMNYYLFFDSPSVTRTTFALRGKDPVTSHINTIMDYTFYWFMGVYDYYQYTGDKQLIEQLYPRMKSLMEYCLSRRNENGMMQGLAGDWVFIDWADFEMSKAGEVSFEQLLFCHSLETMALCANLMNDAENAKIYNQLATDLKSKLFTAFWSDKDNAFIHNRENGVKSTQVTPFTNMFAVLFDYLDQDKTRAVKENVLLNPNALKITTPYMRFYELEALCALGEKKHVLDEIRKYWGGMINLGATSFWEKYNPHEKNPELLAMYGRPFGKSLCHAWGASPIYLLGKYYLGVKPTSPGYQTYAVEPCLGDLLWMEGDVPTPNGRVHLYCSTKEIIVKSDEGTGTLKFKSQSKPFCKTGTIRQIADKQYELTIEKGQKVVVEYKNIE